MVKIRGGARLQKRLNEMAADLGVKATLRVGFLSDATYPDGTSVAMVAAIQNFGNGKIPPRPFFTNMVKTKSAGWPDALAKILVSNEFRAVDALHLLGEGIKGQLAQSIQDTNSPPLSPVTLKRRGVDPAMVFNPSDMATFGAKPLVHTGVMLGSIDSEVSE